MSAQLASVLTDGSALVALSVGFGAIAVADDQAFSESVDYS